MLLNKNLNHLRCAGYRMLMPVLSVALIVVAQGVVVGQSDEPVAANGESVLRVNLSEDGVFYGKVVTLLENEPTPVVAKVSLTQDGKTVATSTTNVVGKFSFQDVAPGTYQMVGVSGEFVANQPIVIGDATPGAPSDMTLQVAPANAQGNVVFSDVPMNTFSSSSSYTSTPVSGTPRFTSSGGGAGGGGGGGMLGGAGSLRNLFIVGAAVAVPVGLSGNDEPASPDN